VLIPCDLTVLVLLLNYAFRFWQCDDAQCSVFLYISHGITIFIALSLLIIIRHSVNLFNDLNACYKINLLYCKTLRSMKNE